MKKLFKYLCGASKWNHEEKRPKDLNNVEREQGTSEGERYQPAVESNGTTFIQKLRRLFGWIFEVFKRNHEENRPEELSDSDNECEQDTSECQRNQHAEESYNFYTRVAPVDKNTQLSEIVSFHED